MGEVDVSKQKLEETAQSLAASMAIAQEVQQRAEVVSSSSSSCSEEAITDIPDIIVDPVEDREVGMDADMTVELEELGKDLESARNEEEESEETKQFRDLLGSGTDKYKTLREVSASLLFLSAPVKILSCRELKKVLHLNVPQMLYDGLW